MTGCTSHPPASHPRQLSLFGEAEVAADLGQAASGTLPPSLDQLGSGDFEALPTRPESAGLETGKGSDMQNVQQEITILSNGSKWYGEEPDTIDKLLEILATEPLDPSFEDYGNFVWLEDGFWHVFGNFWSVSHVFRIQSRSHEAIASIEAALRANQTTAAYQQARIDWIERKAAKEAAWQQELAERVAKRTRGAA